MPIRKITLACIIFVTLLLTGCSGAGAASSWPGINVDGDVAYIAYGTSITAIRSRDGTMVWRYPEKPDNRRSFYAQPTIVGDQIFIGDYTGHLYAINARNGTEQWRFEDANGRFISSPTYTNELIIAASTDHWVYALNTSGQLVWKFETGQAIWAKPAANGDLIYIASMDHYLYALDVQTGNEVWKIDIGGAVVSNPVLDSGSGLLVLSTVGGAVTAIRTEDVSVAWTFQSDGAVWSDPVITEGKIFIGDLTNKFYALDLMNGSQIWSIVLSSPVISTSVAIEGGVVVASEDGTIVNLSQNGDKLWTRTVEGSLYSALVLADDYLLIPVTRGDVLVYALDLNGNDRWSFLPPK